MTLTEHIQEVGSDIKKQRNAIDQLEHRKTASMIASSVGITSLVCLIAFASMPAWNLVLVAAFALFALYNTVVSSRELALTKELLAQNEFYHAFIVEEAYSGKDVGPKFD